MGINFREFFQQKVATERVELFRPHQFRKMFEMALGSVNEPDVVRKPVNIDEDDIQFLQQFPHEFWVRALKMRYDRLFEKLEEYSDLKSSAGHDVLANAIYEAIRKQDEASWRNLLRVGHEIHDVNEHIQINKEHVDRLRKKYKPEDTETWTDEKCLDRADMEADEHLKTILPHLPVKSEVESFDFIDNRFDFDYKNSENPEWPAEGRLGGSNRNKKMVHIEAKPYLNRLYHKLERTEGLDHLEGSGLEGTKAKYGFMLRGATRSPDPKHPHSTSGMKFPTYEQLQTRMQEFMVQNSHRVFGEIDDPDLVWKPTVFQDTEVKKFYKVALESQIVRQLEAKFKTMEKLAREGNAEAEEYIHKKENSTQGERRKQAVQLANDELIRRAERGELKGPPIGPTKPGGPPLAPEGLPLKVEGGKLKNPPLYLPFKEKMVKFRKSDGTVKEMPEWVPLVKSGKFYRAIEAGENIPEDKRMGFRKNYVHVEDESKAYSRGTQRDAAIDFNHNTESLRWLDDDQREQAMRTVFSNQRQVFLHRGQLVPEPESGFYESIMRGIIRCARGCSGITEHETIIMLFDIYEIHSAIMQSILQNLGSLEKSLDTPQKLEQYAVDKAGIYSQKNLGEGGGTRRLRAFVKKIRDERMNLGTPYGARHLDTRDHRNAYRLHNFRRLMQEMANLKAAAEQADAHSKANIDAARQKLSTGLSHNLRKLMQTKGDIVQQMIQVMSLAHQLSNQSTAETAEQWATDQVRSWVEMGADASELVRNMMNLDLVRMIVDEIKASGDDPTDRMSLESNPGLDDEIRSAIQIAKQDLSNQLMRRGNNHNDPEIVERFRSQLPELSQYVKDSQHGGLAQQLSGEFHWLSMPGNEEEMRKVLTAAQKEINHILG